MRRCTQVFGVFAGGHVELGETFIEAARREFREETGVVLGPELGRSIALQEHHLGRREDWRIFPVVSSLREDDIGCFEGECLRFVSVEKLSAMNFAPSILPKIQALVRDDWYERRWGPTACGD